MQIAELIKKIRDAHGLTQGALAARISVGESDLSRYLAGKQNPGPHACLLLAGLAANEDRAAWLALSGLNGEQLRLIASALGVAVESVFSPEEADLLAWYREPSNLMEAALREPVRELLRARKSVSKNPT